MDLHLRWLPVLKHTSILAVSTREPWLPTKQKELLGHCVGVHWLTGYNATSLSSNATQAQQ